MKKIYGLAFVCLGFVALQCSNNNGSAEGNGDVPAPQTPVISFTVVNAFPHDTSYFTEGLEFYKGHLLESTGLEGQSRLALYDLASGNLQKEISLPATSFGEGATVFRDTVYQLTWRESKVYVYSVQDFRKLKELPLNGEGWGLTHDSTALIASNGSNNLYFYEPGTFRLLKKIEVTENDVPAVNLNELEYVNGFVYANQWQMNYILKIDPSNGNVVAKMDLSSLVQQEKTQNPMAAELNGIAYNPETKKFYITGKNWAKIYELQFAF